MTRRKTHGTFTRAGTRRVAFTPAEAVELRFNGWTELAAAPPPTVEATDVSPPAASPRRAVPGRDDSDKNPAAGK